MENKIVSLIDGDFDAHEAKEILLNLYSNKINFHEKKNFSSNIRFGKDDLTSIQRIPKLKEALKIILEALADAEAHNKKLAIKSTVVITFANS
jgi:hypothetical protein